MIRLTENRCTNPHGGSCGPMYAIDFGKGWCVSLNGCGGPYREIKTVSPRGLRPKMKLRIQEKVAGLIRKGVVDRAEGERFLDEVFA